ncbi:unnamed protein product [Didymodactylos carnosus]|uniref:Cortactin-binding protein 2 n=1 Tax=Didymodactylos carnosus TaxID=1234261 RepID=A0A813U4E2_9BILA|nr:unnamed protein product [Didymodactylos carnosus]CAF0821505.1 unnamed protein product [Didymodactylos carnosus]CAF3514768.1 unnamed protein product [Didymodactylos carnosus]CAF3607952.1 unnamed protein product [Didymodactylos carnosus]
MLVTKIGQNVALNLSFFFLLLQRNPKFELKKDELVLLLGRFEAELQAKEIALATMKSEKVKTLLYNARFGRLTGNSDPYSALLRDSETIKEDFLSEQIPMRNVYESQLLQLEHLIVQQKKQVQLLKNILNDSGKKFMTLMQELESEKRYKIRAQTLQNQLLKSQEEKLQLKDDLDKTNLHNKELEQQLLQLLQLLEREQERHKQFVVVLVNERKQLFLHMKSEKEKHKQQIDKIIGDLAQDKDVHQQYEQKCKQLKDEHAQCKDKLNAKIKQLETELELLNEKCQQHQTTSVMRVVNHHSNVLEQDASEANTKQTNHIKDSKSLPDHNKRTQLSANVPSSNAPQIHTNSNVPVTFSPSISAPNDSKSQLPIVNNSNIRRPTIVSSPKTPQLNSVATKISSPRLQAPSSSPSSGIPVSMTSSTSSIPETAPAVVKRSIIPAIHTRNVNNTQITPPLMMSNLRSPSTSSYNIQNSSTSTSTSISGAASRGIPRLNKNALTSSSSSTGNKTTKTSINQEHDSTAAVTTKRLQPSNNHDLKSSSSDVIDDLQKLIDVIQSAVENRLNTEVYPADSQLNINSLYSTTVINNGPTNEQYENFFSSPSSNEVTILLRAAQMGETDQLIKLLSLGLNPNTTSSDGTTVNMKPIELTVCLSSSTSLTSNRERPFSYGIGEIQLTYNMSWLEFEKAIIKIYNEHLAQIDSPFDYAKCSIGITTKSINVICLGQYKWLYQESPDDLNLPYTIVHDQALQTVTICLKGAESNSTDALAYNYFIPSQNLKNFSRYIEQNTYVGVYGAPHTNKHTLFEDLIRQFERSSLPSSTAKFTVIRFGFESVSSIDDCIEELVDADFFQTQKWTTSTKASKVKYLLYLYNVQNGIGIELLKLLLNGKIVSDNCQMLDYISEYSDSPSIVYYYPSTFHIFVTLSKRTWSNENDVLKQFKWIPFKIDAMPWNGILKRYLWRRMVDYCMNNKLPIDSDLIKILQYITNVWQRYNECLQKLSLQDALLGPGIFYDCPMDRESIFDWLQSKWNNIIAPLVRELSMNKCSQPNKKTSSMITSMTSLEINSPYESVACTALYVLLHRTVARECPLTGEEREHYLLNFVGSRLEGGITSMPTSAASSRAGTPQGNVHCDFISIQLE